MLGIIIIGLFLLGYTFIYIGLSKFTNGLTFAEGSAPATPATGTAPGP